MKNTTTKSTVAQTVAFSRVRVDGPQSTNLRLLADTLATHQGTTVSAATVSALTVSAPVLDPRISGADAILRGCNGKTRIQDEGFGPFAGYTTSTTPFMDVAQFRPGRPPV